MPATTELLIVGAGPFALALAAYAEHHGLPYTMVGGAMEFWRSQMPRGMLLRSGYDWHLDPAGVYTIERFLATRGLRPEDATPLGRELYLEYTEWLCRCRRIQPLQRVVRRLDADDANLVATFADGDTLAARRVVLALGMGAFANVPDNLVAVLPPGRFAHTRDAVDLDALRGQRCLIIGGRQSAFEWAALLREAGAADVYVSYRHATPEFTASDWTWVEPLVANMVDNPGWFRSLTPEQQAETQRRLWVEGRLKLEPWLAPRLAFSSIHLCPGTRVERCVVLPDGAIRVQLDTGERFEVDTVILATGYRVDLARVPMLAAGNLLELLETRNGYPVLDEHFQSSVPGLFFTSFAAAQDFGPFFGFTVSARAAASIIGAAYAAQLDR